MNEKVRTVARERREFMPVLDPDFDDDGWRPLLAEPQLHPDCWGAHDYVGVLSGEHYPYYGTSQPYREWCATRAEVRARRRPWSTPQVVGGLELACAGIERGAGTVSSGACRSNAVC
jgi:hypothetical protein